MAVGEFDELYGVVWRGEYWGLNLVGSTEDAHYVGS